jgi:cyclopropane fatty-acyl-phospholipid synthase-like methyltransferase
VSDPTEIVARGYDQIAEAYLAWSQADDSSAREKYLAYLLDVLPEGADVLELGCGAGLPVTKALAEHMEVTAVDISSRQLELARMNAPAASFIRENMAELDFPDGAFDAIVAVHSVTHVPRERHEDLFRRIHNWLRPGGIFVASLGFDDEPGDIDEDWLGAPMFFSHYDSTESRRLLRGVGLELVSDEIVTQLEHGQDCRFLWVVASKL